MVIINTPQELGRGKHLITMLMGSWLIIGIFLDGFAHNHGVVESFFTPWHAVLYSGFLASAAWILGLVYINKQRNNVSLLQAIPSGYGLGVAGVLIFLVGGICDMIWHIIFGIEKNIAALLSPTHLMLLTGALLILSSPFRSAWARRGSGSPTFKEFLPALLSISLVMSIIAFFLMYAWSFRQELWMAGEEDARARAIVDFLITTILLISPILLMLKRWKIPFGTVTFLFVFLSALMTVLDGFANYSSIIIVLVSGLIGDLILRGSAPDKPNLLAYRVFAFLVPVTIWTLYFINQLVFYSLDWPPEFWAGAIVLSALCSLGLSVLMISPRIEIE